MELWLRSIWATVWHQWSVIYTQCRFKSADESIGMNKRSSTLWVRASRAAGAGRFDQRRLWAQSQHKDEPVFWTALLPKIQLLSKSHKSHLWVTLFTGQCWSSGSDSRPEPFSSYVCSVAPVAPLPLLQLWAEEHLQLFFSGAAPGPKAWAETGKKALGLNHTPGMNFKIKELVSGQIWTSLTCRCFIELSSLGSKWDYLMWPVSGAGRSQSEKLNKGSVD